MENGLESRVDFDFLRYANCWEDPEILIQALAINTNTRCLSICSAGDNSLALLSQNPAWVLAVDINPAQIAVAELRKVALAEFEYDRVLEFLGYTPCPDPNQRIEDYGALKKYLSTETRSFLDANLPLIDQGIIQGGKFERYFRFFRRWILPLIHHQKKIYFLLQPHNQDERISFYKRHWDTWRWRLLFRIFFSRPVLGRLGRDPEFFRYVQGKVADRILERTQYALTTLPTHTNPFVNFILTGQFNEALPFYLKKENHERIRNNLDRLVIFRGSVTDALAKYDQPFQAFNLSDIFEYLSLKVFSQIARVLLEKASPGARFAYWNMLAERRISALFPDQVNDLKIISESLFQQDRAFFYRSFQVEEKS